MTAPAITIKIFDGYAFYSAATDRFPSDRKPLIISNPESYSHDIVDIGGFDTCSFSFSGDPKTIFSDWIKSDMIFRRVSVENEFGVVVWEGFTDSLNGSFGPISLDLGPATDIVNMSKASYRTVRYDTNPPVGGDEAETDWFTNDDSIAIFGVRAEIIEAGECSDDEAEQKARAHIADFAFPKTIVNLSIGRSGDGTQATVTINCKGIYHLMDEELYEEDSGTGTQNLDNLVSSAAASSSYVEEAVVSGNSIQVPIVSLKSRTIKDVLQDAITYGSPGSNTNKYTYGMYESGQLVYEPVSIEYAYTYNPFLPDQRIATLDGKPVPYSEVRPGKYMYISGLFIDGTFAPATGNPFTSFDTQRTPPVYIARISYSWPGNELSVDGRGNSLVGRISRKFGLTGK